MSGVYSGAPSTGDGSSRSPRGIPSIDSSRQAGVIRSASTFAMGSFPSPDKRADADDDTFPDLDAADMSWEKARPKTIGTTYLEEGPSGGAPDQKDQGEEQHRVLVLSPTATSDIMANDSVLDDTATSKAFNMTTLTNDTSVMSGLVQKGKDAWQAYENQAAKSSKVISTSGPNQVEDSPKKLAMKKSSVSDGSKDKDMVALIRSASLRKSSAAASTARSKAFQRSDLIPSVQVRVVDIVERAAFESRGFSNVVPFDDNTDGNKVSPPPQHAEVLNRLYGSSQGGRQQQKIRQLCWSPAVSPHADPWGGWDDEYEEKTDTDGDDDSDKIKRKRRLLARKRRMLSRKRIGQSRYVAVNPVSYARSTLPAHVPLLTNTRIRLPCRADVGFPGVTEAEMRSKQMEIIREAEIEEHSPCVAMLVSSGDVGGFGLDELAGGSPVESLSAGARLQMEDFQGLDDIPLAGREMVEARVRHARAVCKEKSDCVEASRPLPGPNPTSTFAPPGGSTYSSTHLWRPRPFTDQPMGMVRFVSIPTNVSFQVGDIEPLVCSLALYCLPPPPQDGSRTSKKAWAYRGKLSEDFVFPAGTWSGKLNQDTLKLIQNQFQASDGDSSSSQEDNGEEQDWRCRTNKALFSYDPLVLPNRGDQRDLYVVLQVHRIAQIDTDVVSVYRSMHAERKLPASPVSPITRKRSISEKIKNLFEEQPNYEAASAELDDGGIDLEGGNSLSLSNSGPSTESVAALGANAQSTFELHGTDFLSPLCFGISPVVSGQGNLSVDPSADEAMAWPNGHCHTTELLSFPDIPDSPEDFVERLARVANANKEKEEDARGSNSGHLDDSFDSSSVSSPSSKLHSPPKLGNSQSSKQLPSSSVQAFLSDGNEDGNVEGKKDFLQNLPIAGNATIFNSFVGVDLTQVLLQTPGVLSQEQQDGERGGLPRLLVDIPGDSAIMINPEAGRKARKRSDLVRLPPSKLPSGYAGASEFRECLYLPPRPDRRYDNDVPTSPNRLLNLLYLYPRELRLEDCKGGNMEVNGDSLYSVRIALVRQSGVSEDGSGSYAATNSIFNPAPGAAPTLDAVYTRLSNKKADISTGIPMLDEIKVRLPDTLDGSHFIQCSLFSLCDTEKSFMPEIVSETFIPLSSSSSREPVSKAHVVTIIPNGVHRIKIGDFQLLVESRLVSSVHSSDPGVALVLRNFPFASEVKNVENHQLMMISSSRGTSFGGFPANNENTRVAPVCKVISNTSEQALLVHFRALVFIHLRNLLNSSRPQFAFKDSRRFFRERRSSSSAPGFTSLTEGTSFLMANLQSLLFLLDKVKSRFQIRSRRQSNSYSHLKDRFLKDFLDSFDEASFSSQLHQVGLDHESTFEPMQAGDEMIDAVESNPSEEDKEAEEKVIDSVLVALEDALLETALNAVAKQDRLKYAPKTVSLSTTVKFRSVRSGVKITKAGDQGLIRTAFGASKTDRMRAEAELYDAGARMTELFDDDETVITTATFMSRRSEFQTDSSSSFLHSNREPMKAGYEFSMSDARASESYRQWGLTANEEGTLFQYNSPVKTMKDDSYFDRFSGTPFAQLAQPIERAKYVAQRINTAAQVALTPCMAPNLSSMLARKASLSPPKRSIRSDFERQEVDSTFIRDLEEAQRTNRVAHDSVRHPGSDVEEDDEDSKPQPDYMKDVFDQAGVPRVRLRGNQTLFGSRLECNVQDVEGGDLSGDGKPYLYECMFTLWLQAWLEFSLSYKSRKRTKGAALETAMLFADNMDFLLPVGLRSLVFRCYSRSEPSKITIPLTLLDTKHMQIFEPLVECIGKSLIFQGLAGEKKDAEWDAKLVKTISSSDVVLDFLVGLLSVIHPAQASMLIFKYFKTLRSCEKQNSSSGSATEDDSKAEATMDKNRSKLRRVICSRQLRLRAAEKFASLPRFVALNFPYKYAEARQGARRSPFSWADQGFDGNGRDYPNLESHCPYPDGNDRLPHSHWLAELLTNECFSICSESCEAVVNEAMAQIKASHEEKGKIKSVLKNRRGASLSRNDLLRFQSTAVHAISIVYELLLRRHALDERFQTMESRSRVAAMFLGPVFATSIKSVQWLAKMESTHKTRSLWLLSFLHVLQEAPEALVRGKLRSYCTSEGLPRLYRFLRLLRLCSSTCQNFIANDPSKNNQSVLMNDLSPWLVQESYNTICASTNILVDECAGLVACLPKEQHKLAQGVLDVILHVLSMPLSSVAHQRGLGGASQALYTFGTTLFLEVLGDKLQHWTRICLTLMNSISLSVRSIAVDFVVSLISGCFDEGGNIDEIALVFLSVLPEVVAREIALYSVSGHVSSMADVEKSIWPLRRALGDIEEANPQDDDRVDPQLSPFLSNLCRACQAVIDGVLIELRLQGDSCSIIGYRVDVMPSSQKTTPSSMQEEGLCRVFTFDADEESLYEAANVFLPETALLQRLRWLITLKSLHEEKEQWVEAAETLLLCANSIADAIPHVRNIWRPSHFVLWHDDCRSQWLTTVGELVGRPDRGNTEVMKFASTFLEPPSITGGQASAQSKTTGMLDRPSLSILCRMLCGLAKDAIDNYLKEPGMEAHAYQRLEQLLKVVMGVVDEYSSVGIKRKSRGNAFVEESAALRKMSAILNGHMTRLAERMLLLAEDKAVNNKGNATNISFTSELPSDQPSTHMNPNQQYYVRVELLGTKTARFRESTSLPTFMEWENPSVCRVPSSALLKASSIEGHTLHFALRGAPSIEKAHGGSSEQRLCLAFAEPLLLALSYEVALESIVFSSVRPSTDIPADDLRTYLIVSLANTDRTVERTKRILFNKEEIESSTSNFGLKSFVEYTVAQEFPCALSRQRTILTSEFSSSI